MIEVYSMPTCSRCKTVKMMLEKRNIDYIELPISEEMQNKFELPMLRHKGKQYEGKQAIMYVRSLEVIHK